ncbi:NADPH2:quinone reductase [Actinoplanes octamycinicus]|uniref:NADPH2:quinone reductase n=1 Tax=Actinoplanes octamycinicus TaxID=135948 RepID=A0A7W7H3I9_9ACTN|nr:zinc-binding dehydrogenase [Actinoplanes octamycinicus]MBB4743346.1 NADPH2:quinone reductase [Actinoplanes octamycinicus]GIE61862.1 oxidoreductase [Actinoplanes octamycinicus]
MRIVRHYNHGDPSVLRVEEAPKPAPGPRDVLIRVEAIGVNFAEVQRRQGLPIGGPAELPGAPGGDVAGTVEAIGDDVTGVQPGDRVVAGVWHGAYADYVTADATSLLAIPDGVDAGQATALLSPAQTAYHAITAGGRLQAGETILIDAAAGGVGHLAVQIAKALGAGKVIATASSPAKLEFARSLGADVAIDYTKDGWAEEVLAATDGKGADVILETVGGDILRQSIPLIAQFGRLVFYGSAAGFDIPPVSVVDLIDMKTVTGFSLYAIMFTQPEVIQAGERDLVNMLATGKLKPVVHTTLPLDEAAKAHELMEARAQLGKVVLVP